jgi:hypothetical protein
MKLKELFAAAKAGTLPPEKAVHLEHKQNLPEVCTLPQDELIKALGDQEALLFDSLEEGYGKVFLGSTVFLSGRMKPCADFADFVLNHSGW